RYNRAAREAGTCLAIGRPPRPVCRATRRPAIAQAQAIPSTSARLFSVAGVTAEPRWRQRHTASGPAPLGHGSSVPVIPAPGRLPELRHRCLPPRATSLPPLLVLRQSTSGDLRHDLLPMANGGLPFPSL